MKELNGFKVKDRVEVRDNVGAWWSGTIININDFREYPFCIDLDGNPVGAEIFVKADRLRKLV